MKVLSLFNGMNVCAMALEDAGVEAETQYISEIDKYANKASEALFPDAIQLGSVLDWRDWNIDWASINLVTGGFPCQAWSMAGKQLGDKDERGMLFWTMLDIIKQVKHYNPDANFLIENVRMKKEFEEYITSHTEKALGEVHKVLINSALVSAQNRNRYYWTSFPVTQPEDKGIILADVLEEGVNKVGRIVGRKINKETGKRDDYNPDIKTVQRVEVRPDSKSGCLTTVQKDNVAIVHPKYNLSNKLINGFYNKKGGFNGRFNPMNPDLKDKSFCLTARYFKCGATDPYIITGTTDHNLYGVSARKLTPRECMRLQTIPEFYIDKLLDAGISNTQLYKMTGNGWTMKVINHILKCMTNQT